MDRLTVWNERTEQAELIDWNGEEWQEFMGELDIPVAMSLEVAVDRLAEYEDADEQGLLLRLPCKVGDVVYLVDFEEKMWDEATVNSIEIDTRDNRVLINSDYEYGTWSEDNYVFYSQSEAEKALAELQSK